MIQAMICCTLPMTTAVHAQAADQGELTFVLTRATLKFRLLQFVRAAA
jgi:hypothetical protein